MKKFYLLLLLCFAFKTSQAQNLIPNPGFEDTISVFCGIFSGPDFSASVHDWYSPTGGTPDLFCSQINQNCYNYQPYSLFTGPIGIKGSQWPRTGAVMAGFYCYTIPNLNQREYIQSSLTSPLVPGTNYCLQFYVSLADNTEKYTNKIGAYLSDVAVSAGNDQPLPFTPQVVALSTISDTANWVLISGTFQATSASNYITIGNFYDDASTPTSLNPGGSSGPGNYGAYYFIDDISLTDCATGMHDFKQDILVSVNPNPVKDKLLIRVNSSQESEIIIRDLLGRKLIQQFFTGTVSLNVENIDRGLFFYEVLVTKGEVIKGKFIKE